MRNLKAWQTHQGDRGLFASHHGARIEDERLPNRVALGEMSVAVCYEVPVVLGQKALYGKMAVAVEEGDVPSVQGQFADTPVKCLACGFDGQLKRGGAIAIAHNEMGRERLKEADNRRSTDIATV